MAKHLLILISLLSIVEIALAQEGDSLAFPTDEKEFVILMANPRDKLILREFLMSPKITKGDALQIKEILKKMIINSDSSNPMMTKQSQGD